MVLAEKGNNNDGGPRNGRRSRGPSPNGMQIQADSTSEDESSVPVDKIRVGRDYQAVCPELQPETLRKPELLADRALLVWSPTADIAESKLEEYIVLAKDKYGYNGEQALGMLFWHKHDLERAVLDLANFTPFPDEWSVEDKVLFEQAFQFHGKSFHRIRQMLPDKSIASLVKYYYGWKKTRSRTSLMDKQARKLQVQVQSATAPLAGKSGDDSQHTALSIGGEHNHTSDPNSANDDSDHEETKKNTSYGGKVPIQPKQTLSLKRKHTDSLDDIRTNDRTACRWTHEELSLAVEGVRKYGKDFKAISEALGNKSEQHVKAFYMNYRKKYGLDMILRDYERGSVPNSIGAAAPSISGGGRTVPIGITASSNKNSNNNHRSGLLLNSGGGNNIQQQMQPLTTIDIADDDDIDDDNTSDVICISPSPPPPSQPLPPPSAPSTAITAQPLPQHTNGNMALPLATVNAPAQTHSATLATAAPAAAAAAAPLAVVAHALK